MAWLWGAEANWRIDNVKQRYHQCMNIECSATFRTLESIDGVIRSPATEPVIPAPAPAATVNRAGA
ncbi:ogr/Delta-like zinc finger family protein [Klebsiella variicola subsp. variicola]|nr:ogr/Delta-like zinc finger family protein [Klebsiella variicola subsp. variicola]